MIDEWAKQWGVSDDAIADFKRRVGVSVIHQSSNSESAVQNKFRLDSSQRGWRLWRNNVGATYTNDGSFIRYGLANDSKVVNDHIKSSDLIGIRPFLIEAEHVGLTIGQFAAVECKRGDWQWSGTDREIAQLRFLELVISLGGYARFYNGGE